MFFTIREIVDIIAMTFIVGYIFSDFFRRIHPSNADPLDRYKIAHRKKHNCKLDNPLIYSALITAPAIIFHELAHKFVGLSLGLQATFHAAYLWLLIGVALKMLNTGFIFFVPAFVSIAGMGSPAQFAAISVAGPLTNGLLWVLGKAAIKYAPKRYQKYNVHLHIFNRINGFLFIFNMLPVPGFDGWSFYSNILTTLF